MLTLRQSQILYKVHGMCITAHKLSNKDYLKPKEEKKLNKLIELIENGLKDIMSC